MKELFKICFLLLLSVGVKAQVPAPSGLPSPYSTGYYRIGWMQNDSGSIPAIRDTASFRPKYIGTQILWLRPGVDTSYWFWTGRHFVKELKTGDVTNATWGNITGTLSNQTDLQNALNSKIGLGSLSATSPIIYDNGTGNISCPSCGISGGGITSLNTLTNPTQLFAIGNTGTSPNIVSSGGTHTFNNPIVNSSDTGIVTPILFNIWNSKQNAITTGSTTQYFRGDFSLATFPTNLSSFTNGPGYITVSSLANLGSGFRIYSPQVPGLKTIVAGTNITIDSNTNNNSLTINSIGGGPSVDTLYRTPGKDSIQFTIAGRYHSILDSAGSGGGGGSDSGIIAGYGIGVQRVGANTRIVSADTTIPTGISPRHVVVDTGVNRLIHVSLAAIRSRTPDFANQQIYLDAAQQSGIFQYISTDVSSVDDSVLTFVTSGGQRWRRFINTNSLNVRIFGATGNGTTDDYYSIQKAMNKIIAVDSLPRTLFFPQGSYSISQPLIAMKWTGTDYTFFTLNLEGQESSDFTVQGPLATIIPTFTNTFAIGYQLARSSLISGLYIKGQFNPPSDAGNWLEYYQRPFATWASNYGVRDSTYSPYAGVVIDPFRLTNTLPPDGGYPGLSAYYRGSGGLSGSGSSGVKINDCHILGFTTDIILSPNGQSSNAENIIVTNTALEVAKVAYAVCQRQSKANFIKNAVSWDRVNTLVDNITYGLKQGQPPYIDGWNVAGNIIRLFNIVQTQFAVVFSNIYAERIYQLGNMSAGVGGMAMTNSYVAFNSSMSPVLTPYAHCDGGGVLFQNCSMRYYDDLFNKRMVFNGASYSFDKCIFDDVPVSTDDLSSTSLNTMSFKDCICKNGQTILGYHDLSGELLTNNAKIVSYGDITVRDGGIFSTSQAGVFNELFLQYHCGSYFRGTTLGSSVAVTVDSVNRLASFTLGTGISGAALVAVGDYVVAVSPFKVVGQVTDINRTTGVCNVKFVPIEFKPGTYTLRANYYDILGGMFTGNITSGSNKISKINLANFLTPPYVGQRLKLSYQLRTVLIDSIWSDTIRTTLNADFTQTSFSNPFNSRTSSNDHFDINCVEPPYNPNNSSILRGYPVLFPAGATWVTQKGPFQSGLGDSTFVCTSPGYLDSAFLGKHIQATWRGYVNTDDSIHLASKYGVDTMRTNLYASIRSIPTTTNIGSTQGATSYPLTSSTGTGTTLFTATTSLAGLLDTARAKLVDSIKNRTFTGFSGTTNIGSTQNALNYSLTSSSGSGTTLLTATHSLAGLMDTASKAVDDSLRARTYTFPIANLYAANGLSASTVIADTFYLGGPLNQNTTLGTAGFNFSITGLPNKSTALSTDSVPIIDAAGKMWKLPVPSGAGSGTVTSVATGLGLSGGPITTTGTLLADTTYLFTKGSNQVASGNKTFSGTLTASSTVNMTGLTYSSGGPSFDVITQDTSTGKLWRTPYFNFDTTGYSSGSTYATFNGSKIVLATPSSTNFYNTDGTLTANRTVLGASKTLAWGTIGSPFGAVTAYGANWAFRTTSSGTFTIGGDGQTHNISLTSQDYTSISGGLANGIWNVITTGSSSTLDFTATNTLFNPGTAITTYTVTLPTSTSLPDGYIVIFHFGGTITTGPVVTALTVSANSGQSIIQSTPPTSGNAGDCIVYKYRSSSTTWYREK